MVISYISQKTFPPLQRMHVNITSQRWACGHNKPSFFWDCACGTQQNVRPREHLFLDFKILKGNPKGLMSAIYVYVEIVTIKHLKTVFK